MKNNRNLPYKTTVKALLKKLSISTFLNILDFARYYYLQ